MLADHSVVDEIIHAEADQLLNRLGLRDLIEQYAPVSVVGSYALGLMVWRDLDLAMNAPNISVSDFLALGRQINNRVLPTKTSFKNNLQLSHPGDPRGLYWGIRLGDIRLGAWKIDIWAFDSALYRSKVDECEALKRRLNAENRR